MTAETLFVRRRRSSLRMRTRLCLALICIGWMAVSVASAQEADPVRAGAPAQQADSVRAGAPASRADSVRAGATDDFDAARSDTAEHRSTGGSAGAGITDSLPVRLASMDLSDLLGDLPGSFLYRFATPGWPDGWSPEGLPPHRSMLSLNGLPFTHLFTGRPGIDIAPLAFIDPPWLTFGQFDRPAAVAMSIRPFANPRPLTELKYWKGGDGLESIDAVHAQHRLMSIFGRPGYLNLMGSYSGRGADGEYPGSELHRGRQVQVRIRYEQPGWSAELHEMHTRRSVGAHGGVIPGDDGFDSVYRRIGAVVEDPAAQRRLIRNDLAATARGRVFGGTTTLGAFWTAETFRYRDVADTAGTASNRLGMRILQPLPGGLAAEFVMWTEHVDPRYGFAAEPQRRSELHATIRDSLAILGWTTSVAAGVHAYDGAAHAGGSIEIARDAGSLGLRVGASLSGKPRSAVEDMGFLALGGAAFDRTGRSAAVFAAVTWRGGSFDVSLRGFGNRTTEPRDLYMATDYQDVPDSASVLIAPSPMLRIGAAMDFGWRRDAERGFYGLLQPSTVRLVNHGDSDLHTRTRRALPELFGRARLGARYLLFRGDLDLDAFAEAHVWSRTTGRALHPETGLLAVPLLGAMEFGPSSMLNVGIEAGVRDATIFAVFENVLSGTALMAGNLVVPVYPLPAQRLRFGVHWPIFD